MRTSAIIRIIIWAIVAIFLIGILLNGINGGGLFGFDIGFLGYKYENSERYLIGNGEIQVNDVKNVEVNWVAGKIQIIEHDGDSIEFYEESTSDLSEKNKLRYLAENGNLIIQYQKAKVFTGFTFGNSRSKTLVMKIPKSLDIDLNDLKIDTISSNVEISNISANNIGVDVVSGNVNMTDVKSRNLSVDIVSGKTEISGEFEEIKHDGVSGKVTMDLNECPDNINVETVSGSINITIPDNDGFRAEHSSISGKFTCDFEVTSSDDEVVYKNGKADFKLETVSGRISVFKK